MAMTSWCASYLLLPQEMEAQGDKVGKAVNEAFMASPEFEQLSLNFAPCF